MLKLGTILTEEGKLGTKNIGTVLLKPDYDRLREHCKKNGTRVGTFIRDLILDYLATQGQEKE